MDPKLSIRPTGKGEKATLVKIHVLYAFCVLTKEFGLYILLDYLCDLKTINP